RPLLHVMATCTDDDQSGCSVMVQLTNVVVGNGLVLAKSTGPSLDAIIRLDAPYATVPYTTAGLLFRATDSAGHQATLIQAVYLDPSDHYTEVAAVPGRVLDFDATRVLYVGSAQPTAGGPRLIAVRNRATGTDTPIVTTFKAANGGLTPSGAVVSASTGS